MLLLLVQLLIRHLRISLPTPTRMVRLISLPQHCRTIRHDIVVCSASNRFLRGRADVACSAALCQVLARDGIGEWVKEWGLAAGERGKYARGVGAAGGSWVTGAHDLAVFVFCLVGPDVALACARRGPVSWRAGRRRQGKAYRRGRGKRFQPFGLYVKVI